MKTTLMYLRLILAIILAIIIVIAGTVGAVTTFLSVFNSIYLRSASPLVLLPIGLFLGLICVVALDCLKYFVHKWGWDK